jgi:gamma-glutamyl:cysteine ligase YbdK (ATP-grasp superfamily)
VTDPDLAPRVRDVLAADAEEFQRRVREGADRVVAAAEDGAFDNPQAIVGLEYEFYAVDAETTALARVPRRLLTFVGFEAELGLHNAELSTRPQPLNAAGLGAQEAEVLSQLRTAQDCAASEDMRLVSDGLWTIPPVGETARSYLTDSAEVDGITVATNMSGATRYHAMGNAPGSVEAGMELDAPNVSLSADTVLPESLITSIQPHYQVPQATDLPRYFRYSVRIAGPLLALGVNAPLFPPDLYDDVPPETILADARDEERIFVFESVLNPPDGDPKVRFPRDVDSVRTAVDRIAADDVVVPMPVEPSDRFDDEFAAFRVKHGTFWRWVRPVFEGATRSAANARIEFRPIPGQPTVRDAVAFQALFAGLLESLPRLEHPVADMDWATARENFYDAARDGLDADLTWITNDGRTVTDREALFGDLFDHAEDGLARRGLDDEAVATYLWPLRKRARHGFTPADWKRKRVREHLEEGTAFAAAVEGMQREYVERQAEVLLDGSFADWIDEENYLGR